MKRRSFLKALCASPLGLLVRKRRSGTRKATDKEVAQFANIRELCKWKYKNDPDYKRLCDSFKYYG